MTKREQVLIEMVRDIRPLVEDARRKCPLSRDPDDAAFAQLLTRWLELADEWLPHEPNYEI